MDKEINPEEYEVKEITILDTETGVELIIDVGDFIMSLGWWLNGNGSCDCVRYDYFYDDDVDYPCTGQRFRITEFNGIPFEEEGVSELEEFIRQLKEKE